MYFKNTFISLRLIFKMPQVTTQNIHMAIDSGSLGHQYTSKSKQPQYLSSVVFLIGHTTD